MTPLLGCCHFDLSSREGRKVIDNSELLVADFDSAKLISLYGLCMGYALRKLFTLILEQWFAFE